MNATLTGRHIVRRGVVVLIVCAALTAFGITLAVVSGAADGLTRGGAGAHSPAGIAELGAADGHIADGDSISPFDSDHPALAHLDAALREAVQSAAQDAEADGIPMVISSGWRSERYQQALFDEAIAEYGNEQEASKWVKSASTSSHVTGLAVDIGYTDADSWLSQHGSDYGLCQTYSNEMWHFELAVSPGEMCPAPVSDASAG